MLLTEYEANPGFRPKVEAFVTQFGSIRRVRGDGSCFYRCLLAGILDLFVRNRVQTPGAKAGCAEAEAEAGAGAEAGDGGRAQTLYEEVLGVVRVLPPK